MAKRKIIETTAVPTQENREEPKNHEDEGIDPFQFFRDETQQCLVAIRRIEPSVEQGHVVAGHLPSLTLSPQEAQNLASILISKPGYGGGLYAVQHQRQKVTGGYEFGSSFRLRVAGPSRALELHVSSQPPVAPPPAPTASQQLPQQAAQQGYGPPPPWWYQQPQYMGQPQIQPQMTMQDLPKILEAVINMARAQPTSPLLGQMDVVQLIQSLQRTVQGEDEMSKFAKFAGIMDKIRGKQEGQAGEGGTGTDWVSIAMAVRELVRPNAPTPAPQVTPQAQRQVVPRRPATAPIPPPPGWHWTGAQWVQVQPKNEVPPPPVEPTPPEQLRVVPEDEGEGEDEEEGDFDDDGPMTAEELAMNIAEDFARMAPEEQEKLKKLYAGMMAS